MPSPSPRFDGLGVHCGQNRLLRRPIIPHGFHLIHYLRLTRARAAGLLALTAGNCGTDSDGDALTLARAIIRERQRDGVAVAKRRRWGVSCVWDAALRRWLSMVHLQNAGVMGEPGEQTYTGPGPTYVHTPKP